MKGDLFMASKKQEIRKQLKKKEAKELEELGFTYFCIGKKVR